MKKLTLAAVLGSLMVLLVSSTALAHYCTNQNKPIGAGSMGTVVLDPATGEFVSFELNDPYDDLYNSGTLSWEQPVAGFITFVVGEHVFDLFVHTTLPDGALNAGPGDSACDGVGIDNALACLGLEAEH